MLQQGIPDCYRRTPPGELHSRGFGSAEALALEVQTRSWRADSVRTHMHTHMRIPHPASEFILRLYLNVEQRRCWDFSCACR